MTRKDGSISQRDFTFAVYVFMFATVLRSGYIIGITQQDSWAMAITGFLFSLPIVAVYGLLLKKFPGKNLFEIDNIVFGPILGRAVSSLYLFFFLSLVALNTRDLGNFAVDYLMPGTPIAAIFVFFIAGCTLGIRKGIQNLLYLSTFICIIVIAAITLNTILVLNDVTPGFLKPMFQLELGKYVQATVSVSAVPLGESLAFMMLTPMLGKNANAARPLLLGLLLTVVSMVAVIMRDIITLGPLVAIVSLPSFESVRYISLAGILTRMESLYAVVLVLLFLFKVSILLYASALGLTQLLSGRNDLSVRPDRTTEAMRNQEKKGGPPLLFLSSALAFFYTLFIFESVMDNMDWGATVAPFFSLTFELALPAIALLVAALRKKARRGRWKHESAACDFGLCGHRPARPTRHVQAKEVA